MIDERSVTIFRLGDWPIFPVSRRQWYTIGDEAHVVTWRQWLWFVWAVYDEYCGDRSKLYYPRLMWRHPWMVRAKISADMHRRNHEVDAALDEATSFR